MKYSVLILLIWFQQDLLGQSTFNLEFIDGDYNSSGIQILESNGLYYFVTKGFFVNDGVHPSTTVRKLNGEGVELGLTELNNDMLGFSTYLYGCGILSDGTIIVSGSTQIDGVHHLIIQRISNNLNLIGEPFLMASPYNPELEDGPNSFIATSTIEIDEEDNIYVAALINGANDNGNDVLICKFSDQLELQWEYIHEEEQDQVVYSMLFEGGALYAFQIGEFDFVQNSLTKRKLKFEEDDNGQPYLNENMEIDFPQGQRILETISDGEGFVIVGTRIDELALENSPIIFKLNYDGLYQWYSPPSIDFNVEDQSYLGISIAHNGGYVCVGMEVDYGDNSEGWGYDLDRFGNLTKHSSVGSVEWHRRISIIESCDETHTLTDVLKVEDGYWVCGTRSDFCFDENWESNYPIQRSWLVKTDECGCIVPGCGEKDCYIGLDEEKPDQLNILLYPNPSSDYCSIYIPEGFQSRHLQVFNSLGQVIIEKNGLVDDTTYIIPVSSWENGIYILNVVSENNVVESHKIEVLRH